ncbi:MAG TPA: glycosyltransferase family 2 protein [Gemmatimonadaceae bacterium]|nr:glycosyltransferase family 2 protein [Gemmatimonadaceae bacterium]
MELIFWLLLLTVAWCYGGYPLFVAARARLHPRPLKRPARPIRPSVSVVLAVRNERSTLERRVANLFAQDYPADRLGVVIACNGSQDGTEELARELAAREPRISVVQSPAERGKAGAINLAVEAATGDVVVFADARQTFAPDAVARLVEPFGDPGVGAVTGALLVERADHASVEGVRMYWGLEMRLRDAESRSGSVVGATGAIYAIRRFLFEPVPANLILDDVYVPLRIAMRGNRVVMSTDAIAYDVPASDQKLEYARKRRTMVGNIQLVREVPDLLSPVHNPLFLRFFSHKVLRLLTPFCFVALLLVSAAIAEPLYLAFFTAELAVYVLGIVGLTVSVPALSVPSAFVLLHAAVFAAAWRWRDDASRVWVHGTPVRLEPVPVARLSRAADSVV